MNRYIDILEIVVAHQPLQPEAATVLQLRRRFKESWSATAPTHHVNETAAVAANRNFPPQDAGSEATGDSNVFSPSLPQWRVR